MCCSRPAPATACGWNWFATCRGCIAWRHIRDALSVTILASALLHLRSGEDGQGTELADAALAIANAVLCVDADVRRRARIGLTTAMTVHNSHPLAQILAIRFGSWP